MWARLTDEEQLKVLAERKTLVRQAAVVGTEDEPEAKRQRVEKSDKFVEEAIAGEFGAVSM